MSNVSPSSRDAERSTFGFWLSRFRQPFCQHDFRPIGVAEDRYMGRCDVMECRRCGKRTHAAMRRHTAPA